MDVNAWFGGAGGRGDTWGLLGDFFSVWGGGKGMLKKGGQGREKREKKEREKKRGKKNIMMWFRFKEPTPLSLYQTVTRISVKDTVKCSILQQKTPFFSDEQLQQGR